MQCNKPEDQLHVRKYHARAALFRWIIVDIIRKKTHTHTHFMSLIHNIPAKKVACVRALRNFGKLRIGVLQKETYITKELHYGFDCSLPIASKK